MVRSYICNNLPLPSENSDLYDELGKNGIIMDQSMTREQLSSPPWTSTFDINTELSSFLKQQTPPEIYRRNFQSILENYREYQEVYTDASKTQDQIGISIILRNQNVTLKLPNTCSIYTADT